MQNPNSFNAQPNDPKDNDYRLFLEYIKQDPRYADLVKSAKEGKSLTPENQNVLQKPMGMLIADPKDFYGTSEVKRELKKEAENIATMNTSANWFDFFTNLSFWYFLFKSSGVIPSAMMTLVASGLILSTCNVAAKTASNRRRENLALSNAALGGLIALNVVKSLFSGVGMELSLNQSGLNQQMAHQLIETQIQQVETLKTLEDPQYLNTVDRCEKGRQELEKMERNHPRWDSLYQELFGSWSDKDRSWENVPIDQVPLCQRVDILEKRAFAVYQSAKETLNQKLLRRTDLGNDLAFLREEMPQVYATKFQDQGDISSAEIISGIDAIAMATENFFGKLMRGEWSNLSASLFGFSLSVITSALAIFMTLKYAERQDVKRSRDEALAQVRDNWMEDQWRGLIKGQNHGLNLRQPPDESVN